jgi:putative cell wall-binding protein
MGKFTRRAAIGAATFVGAMALSNIAIAADDTRPVDIDGDPDIKSERGPDIWRFADKDRVGTAVEAAERTNGLWGDTVIIATSGISKGGKVSEQGFADALTVTPLADLLDAPVLLNNEGDKLDSRVEDFIEDEGFENAIIIGGDSLFSEKFVDDLEDALDDGDVERIYGANRYETSVKVANYTFRHADDNRDYKEANIFLASGTDFADALSAGAAAAENDGVVLLTDGDDRVYDSVYKFVVNHQWSDYNWINHGATYGIGGPAVKAAANGNGHGESIDLDHKIVGKDRYETATLVAEKLFDDPENVVIASGLKYPDAVVGGAYAGNVDGPLLLTRHHTLDKYTEDYLLDHRSDIENVFVFGGEGSIHRDVSKDIKDLDWDY